MTKHLLITLFILPLFICSIANGQPLRKPKKVKANGEYRHPSTGTIFPKYIGEYERNKLSTYTDELDIAAVYEPVYQGISTRVTIFVYPAGKASDIRFRQHFADCMSAISLRQGHNVYPKYRLCTYTKDGYKVNGIRGSVFEGDTKDVLEIYECGEWFLKIRVTTSEMDLSQIYRFNDSLVQMLDPVSLVKQSTLSFQSNITVTKNALCDSGYLFFNFFCALEKAIWSEKNVDSIERMAGFPDLYLDEHVYILKAFVVESDTSKGFVHTPYIDEYVRQLKGLITNGYLDEFVYDQYDRVMIVPEDHVFDSEGYYKWEKKHPISLDLTNRDYRIDYLTKEEAAKAKKEKE